MSKVRLKRFHTLDIQASGAPGKLKFVEKVKTAFRRLLHQALSTSAVSQRITSNGSQTHKQTQGTQGPSRTLNARTQSPPPTYQARRNSGSPPATLRAGSPPKGRSNVFSEVKTFPEVGTFFSRWALFSRG